MCKQFFVNINEENVRQLKKDIIKAYKERNNGRL